MSASSFETHFLPEDIGALGEEQVGRHQRVVEQSLGVVAVELGTTHLTATLALMTSRSPGCKVTEEAAPGKVEEIAGDGKRWAGPVLCFTTGTAA